MQNDNKKGTRILIGSFIVAIIIILWFKGCSGDSKTKTVIVPEVKGTFAPVKPKHTPLSKPDKSSIDHTTFGQNLSKKEIEFWKNETQKALLESKIMLDQYNKANDSLKRVIYEQAIALNAFNHTFDNDTISATVKGIVRGEIQSIKLDYKIKQRTIEVPKQKEVIFRMLGGVEVGATKDIDKFNVKASAGFQNRKGNILILGYDTEQRIYVGYTTSIFSIKGK